MLDAALSSGYDTRIGLEDALTLPHGSRTLGNAELVFTTIGISHTQEK
jgi:uncharacterized protein (DUF849 family)